MASILTFDELNSEDNRLGNIKAYEKYFSVMNLTESEIQERVDLATEFDKEFRGFFMLAISMLFLEKDLDRDALYNLAYSSYIDLLERYGYSSDLAREHASMICQEIVDTTIASQNLSNERLMSISRNEANSICNCQRDIRMMNLGYKYKKWITNVDGHERYTHGAAHGQIVDIGKPFWIGNSQMMYPMDTSLNAEAQEIINCRCKCDYFR